MRHFPRLLPLAAVLSLLATAGLAACAGAPTPASSGHTTAATGFGLGPEDFRSNGGAFGPDQLSK